jgi:PASTA domain/Divergent InlB B-repeat domain
LKRILGIALLLAALAPLQAGGSNMTLPRSNVDRQDDLSGLQVHMIYALPSDGVDRSFDIDGSIQSSVEAFQRWLSAQTGGRTLRIDTFQGQVDVTFVRLRLTDAEIAAHRDLALEAIDPEIVAAGFTAPGKVYAVYYDGTNPVVCGNAKWPPLWPGKTAAFYLRGLSGNCFSQGFPPPGGQPNYTTFAMFHDALHPTGIVGQCAPHHHPTNPGHVADSNTDLMYGGGSLGWAPSILDLGHDDYFDAHIPGCPDLATNGFLAGDVDFALTVAKEGNGTGTVKSVLFPLIDCGQSCATTYGRGTIVTLTAEPQADSSFAGWGGGCSGTGPCVVTMDADTAVTARFDAPPPPPPPPPPPALRQCRVPRVIGLRLAKARTRIRRAHCSVGRVRRARSRRVGRVISQSPRAGARRPRGTRVKLVVGRR